MTAGLGTTYANAALNTIGTAAAFVQLHTGDPGAAGTSSISSTTTRESVTWNAAAAGVMTASNSPAWPAWAGTSPEVLTYLSFWTLASGGAFVCSQQQATSVTMITGSPLTLSSQTLTLSAVAA